jgi:hypothetical protein
MRLYLKLSLLITLLAFYSFVLSQNAQALPSHAELKQAGLISILDPQFGSTCKNDGSTDCTQTIQKAMNYGYANRLVTFFPPGTYTVRETLKALLDRGEGRKLGYVLVGSTATGTYPTIRLAPNSFNDQNAQNDTTYEDGKKKAIIHFWTCVADKDVSKECQPSYAEQLAQVNATNGNTAMQFGGSLQNLRFLIESGNPDAIGVRFTGNQNNSISNIMIESQDAFAGLYGSIGTNSLSENITIKGGKYGIYGGYGGWGAYTNLTLLNQSVLALTSHQGPPVSVSGFEIIKSQAPAIGPAAGVNYAGGNTRHGGSYSLNDGVISFQSSNNQPAINNPDGHQIAVVNVFVNKAATLVRTEDTSYPGNSSGWSHITTFANSMAQEGYKLIEGKSTTGDYAPEGSFRLSNVSTPNPNALKLTHGLELGRLPSPDVLIEQSKISGSGVVNAVSAGVAKVTSLTESSPDAASKLNQLFADSKIKYVFLPKGIYPLKSTITLGKNTHLVGISNLFSELETHPAWQPGKRVDMIATVNDASATTLLAHLLFRYDTAKGNNFFDGVHWRAGKQSVMYDIMKRGKGSSTNCYSLNDGGYGNERNDYRFSGNGGGRVWGLSTGANGCSKVSEKYRGLLVDNTTQPLTIYGFNPEDGHGEAISEREGFMAEIRNAKNVTIRSHKSEDANSLLIRNSENIFILNPGGSIDWALRDNRNIIVANAAAKFSLWKDSTGAHTNVKQILEEEINGTITQRYNSKQAVSIIKRGSVDFTVWETGSIVATPTPIQGNEWDLDDDNDVDVFDFNQFVVKVLKKTESWSKLASFIAAFSY